MCLEEDDSVAFISYLLPNAQPIRFVSPSNRYIYIPEDFGMLRVSCKVEGNPRSVITFKREDPKYTDNSEKTSSDNCLEILYESFSHLFDRGWYACYATNLWETVVYRIHLDVHMEPVTEKPRNDSKTSRCCHGDCVVTCLSHVGHTLITYQSSILIVFYSCR